ncbi:TPA: hypothetical protein ACY4PQ_001720 [Vibrio parahaemolyticus]
MNNQKQVYSVSYDLNSPGQKYKKVDGILTKLGGIKLMETYWLVASGLTLQEVTDEVMKALDSNDKLVVVECDITCAMGFNLDAARLAKWRSLHSLDC